jgi:hypothetical protein
MPFGDEFLPIYRECIQNTARLLGLKAERADDISAGNQIMQDVWTGILSAEIVIADRTDRNPNVFYEIGIAHTVGKRVILLSGNAGRYPRRSSAL